MKKKIMIAGLEMDMPTDLEGFIDGLRKLDEHHQVERVELTEKEKGTLYFVNHMFHIDPLMKRGVMALALALNVAIVSGHQQLFEDLVIGPLEEIGNVLRHTGDNSL